RADGGVAHHVVDLRPGRRREQRVGRLVAGRASPPQQELGAAALGGRQLRVCLGGVVGGDDADPGDDVRLGQLRRGAELAAVDGDGGLERVGCEVRRERVRQAQGRGEPGAEQRRAEGVEGYVVALA